jgi:hypothetical protein
VGSGAALLGAPMRCQMDALRRATDATQRALTKALVGLSDSLWLLQQEQRGQCFPQPLRAPWE